MKKEPSLFILLLLASFASVSAVLFTPALPEIANFLGISSSQAEWTITIFLIGYAFGNLPWGPFSNRFGRKPAIYWGIALAILGSILVILVQWFPLFWLFLLGRFLSALGSSVGLKIAFTMIGDVYQGEAATRKISYFMLSFAMGPGIAIALGGFLTDTFGWSSTFYSLMGYSILLFILSLSLPETCQEKKPESLKIGKIATGYLNTFKNARIILSAFLMGCGGCFVYLFAAAAPFIGIDRIGLRPDQYGLLNFIPPLGMLAGTALTRKLTGKRDSLSIMLIGILIALAGAFFMLVSFLAGIVTAWTLFLPMPLLYAGLSLVFANASSLAMSHAKDKSNASAIMNFLNMGTCCIALFIFGLFPQQIFLLPLAFTFIALIMLLLRRRLQLLT